MNKWNMWKSASMTAWMDGCIDGWKDGWVVYWMDGLIDEQVYGFMVGWTGDRMNEQYVEILIRWECSSRQTRRQTDTPIDRQTDRPRE